MSRVVSLLRPGARRAIAFGLSLGLLSAVAGVPASAQDLPGCEGDRTSDCILPDWSDAIQRDIPSLFGDPVGRVWISAPQGDTAPAGLDILGVGIAEVDIADPEPIRTSDELLKLGKVKKAVSGGPGVLVRIVLDRSVSEIESGHAGVHVATDIDGSRSNNAPTGVKDPGNPFAGTQDIYSLTHATTTGKTRLLGSDLARGWYKDKGPFAASWAAPNVLDVLVSPEAFGDGFRVITFVSGDEGGYDSVSIGPSMIPASGQVGLLPSCVEGSISGQPFTVNRLVENGQTLRNVEAPASWRGGVRFPLDEASRRALEAIVAAADEDGDGQIGLPATVSLFEDGVVIRQRPDLQLVLDGDHAQLALELGLTRRGYNVLRDVELQSTGDEVADAWLERASDALSETMPPFRSTKKAGLVAGEAIGACVPALISAPAPVLEPSAEPGASDAAVGA